ncbi:MAG: hypothetical protein GY856_42800 [bacterium]|nr:hypothetical protein [bacterium]
MRRGRAGQKTGLTALFFVAALTALIVPAGAVVDDRVSLASGIEVAFHVPATVEAGESIEWSAAVVNRARETRRVRVVLSGSVLDPRGRPIADLGERMDAIVVVEPGRSETVTLPVPESSLTAWITTTRTFGVSLFLEVMGTSDRWASSGRTRVVTAEFMIGPIPSIVDPGEPLTLRAEFVNPLSQALTSATAVIAVDEGLAIDGGYQATVDLGTVEPGGRLIIVKEIEAVSPGEHGVLVLLTSDQLSEVTGEATVNVAGRGSD